MRKKHRRLALILTVALLLNLLLPGSAFAAESDLPTFEVGTAQGKHGCTVEIPIYVKNNPGIASIKLSVTYDRNTLNLTNASVNMPQGTVTNSPNVNAYPYILNWVGSTYVHQEKDFEFAVLTFSILENAPSGHTEISIEYDADDVFDGDENNIAFATKNGGIAVPHTSVTATVDAPAKGVALDSTVDVGDATGYTGTVEWYKGNSATGTAVAGNAEANQVYTAKITLKAGENEIFDETLNGTSTTDGYQITRVSDTELTLTKTFSATLAKELQSLEMTTPPSTTTYTHGDQFNSAGMVVKATYDDDTADEGFTGYIVEYATAEKDYLKKGDTAVTLKAGSQSVAVNNLTVNAKELTISGLTAANRTYDGTTNVTLSGGTLTGVISGETVSATMPTAGTISDANVGNSKEVTFSNITLTGADAANYTLTQPTVTVNISAKALANNMITLGTQKTYTGTEQEVVITSVQDGSSNLTKDADYTVTSGDKATNVENTTLTITGQGNYSGSATAVWSLQKAVPTASDFSVTVPDSGGTPYTGSPISAAEPTTEKAGMGDITVKYDLGTTAPTNAGSYTVTFDVAEGTNYKAASGLTIGTLKINKVDYTGTKTKDVTVRSNQEATDKTLILPDLPAGASYGTASATTSNGLITVTPAVSGTTLTYSVSSKDANTTEIVTILVTGATNYNDYAVTVTFTAKDKDDAGVSVTSTSAAVKYGETVTITASNAQGGTGTWTWNYPEEFFVAEGATNTASITLKAIKADASAQTVTAKFENADYIGTADASVTVNKAASAVATAPTAKTGLAYTGSAQALVTEGAATGGTLQYSVDNGAYGTSVPTGTDAKSYTVKYKVVGDANHDDSDEQTLTVAIAKADPNIGTVSKSAPATIYPHTELNTITLTCDGVDKDKGTLKLTEGQTLTVGTKDYNWTFTPTDTNNYNTKTGPVSLAVTADTLASIAVKASTAPTKTAYQWGEEFAIAGAVIEATYASGTKKDVTADKLTYNKSLIVGQDKVTVSYTEDGVTKTCDITGLTVSKADAKTLVDVPVSLKFDVNTEQAVSLGAVGMPADAGTLSYTKGTEVTIGTVTVSSWDVDIATGAVTYTLSGGAVDDTVNLPVKINSTNYEESTVNVVISLKDKDVPTLTVGDITVTYNDSPVPATAINGTAKMGNTTVSGTWAWKGTPAVTAVADSGVKTVVFTPTDTGAYATVEINLTLTINKATPTGTPAYTPITTTGKTLADAALAIGTITPAGGMVAWNDGDSKAVDANTAYGWTYTPSDTANYNDLTGNIVPYQSNSGDSNIPSVPEVPSIPDFPSIPNNGISGGSSGTITSTTTKNPDGSTTTKTEDKATGTVTETTKNPDGSQTKVETEKDGTVTITETDKAGNRTETVAKPDGSSVTSVTKMDGTIAAVITDVSGKMEAVVVLPATAVSQAQRENTSVALPIPEVRVTNRAETAPVVTVQTGSMEPVKVEIPATNTTPGTVAVLVRADGTEEVIKTSLSTEGGVTAALTDGATVKIVDNSKAFVDVPANHWAADAVSFSSARELFSGTSEAAFSPEKPVTRAMLMTILARFDGADTNGGSTWYEKAVDWAITNGISDGSDPNGNITREQLATILYRYAQKQGKDVSLDENTSFLIWKDVFDISDWAKSAMFWCIQEGLINGKGDGTLDPQGRATRAEAAAILQRFCEMQ